MLTRSLRARCIARSGFYGEGTRAPKRQKGRAWEFVVKRKGLLPKPLYFTFADERETRTSKDSRRCSIIVSCHRSLRNGKVPCAQSETQFVLHAIGSDCAEGRLEGVKCGPNEVGLTPTSAQPLAAGGGELCVGRAPPLSITYDIGHWSYLRRQSPPLFCRHECSSECPRSRDFRADGTPPLS
jgi:hypothetical protein